MTVIDNEAIVKGNMSFTVGNGIKIGNAAVLIRPNKTDIQLGAVGGDILLGTDQMNKVRLLTGITDIHGNKSLIVQIWRGLFSGFIKSKTQFR